MKKLNRHLVDVLNRWGAWSAEGVHGLGYSSCTPEAKLYTSPGRASIVKPNPPTFRIDRIASRVDKAVANCDHDVRCIMHCLYVERMPLRRIMRKLGEPSPGRARWRIEKAHRPVAKQLRIEVY